MKVLLITIADHMLFMEGLQSILQSNGIDVMGRIMNYRDSLYQVPQLRPDAVIINLSESPENTAKAMRRLLKKVPAGNTLVLTDNKEDIKAASRAGISGYLLSEIHGNDLINKLIELETMNYV